ncbi:potassium-transporting ATPase subunit F [Synechocystis sp. LKSZ1]|uniref:potassium-transporting ATPase subunit F n=1 Tax=Synechocystis sp. LKSZ1 TaxID=3144951 RepID=UPI00336C2B84
MKYPRLPLTNPVAQISEVFSILGSAAQRQKLPRYLFLGLCLNLILAPVVYGATGDALSRHQAWALGLLLIGTLSLSVYLFFVMFLPEKF